MPNIIFGDGVEDEILIDKDATVSPLSEREKFIRQGIPLIYYKGGSFV